jgi:hypothetical protein
VSFCLPRRSRPKAGAKRQRSRRTCLKLQGITDCGLEEVRTAEAKGMKALFESRAPARNRNRNQSQDSDTVEATASAAIPVPAADTAASTEEKPRPAQRDGVNPV